MQRGDLKVGDIVRLTAELKRTGTIHWDNDPNALYVVYEDHVPKYHKCVKIKNLHTGNLYNRQDASANGRLSAKWLELDPFMNACKKVKEREDAAR